MSPRRLSQGLEALVQQQLLICPHCSAPLAAHNGSLVCAKRHTFDIARQGYVNLAGVSAKPVAREASYSEEFVQARAEAIERGFFKTLTACAAEIIHRQSFHSRMGCETLRMLDAGSGEGSFLDSLLHHLKRRNESPVASPATSPQIPIALGIDLAVPGVRHAAARFRNIAWCVADLAHIPMPSHSANVILNILSPANYAEFARLLKPNGIIIKAVPQPNHLCEIRSLLQGADQFSNQKVVEHFKSSLRHLETHRVESHISCGMERAKHLFHMTPLSWHATEEQKRRFIESPPDQLTVAFEILVGTSQ